MMKKLKMISVFVAVLGMLSFSENEVADTDNSVLGTWTPTALTYVGTASPTVQGQTATMDFSVRKI